MAQVAGTNDNYFLTPNFARYFESAWTSLIDSSGGNDYDLQIENFEGYYNVVDDDEENITYDKIFPYRQARFNHSIENNPYFFFSPFSGMLVAPAGFSFPPAMMSVKSAEYPEGYLNRDISKSFFAVEGKPGSFTYKKGWERIPTPLYKRAIGDEYSIAGFLADVLDYAIKDPRLLDITANPGEANKPTIIDFGSVIKGVFNTGDLLKGNNLECLLYQIGLAAALDTLGGTYSDLGVATSLLSTTVAERLLGLACPKLQSLDDEAFSKFPGYKKYTSYE
jgi:hypothetical protein